MDQKTGDGGVESSIRRARRARRIRIIAWLAFLGALAVIFGLQAGKAYVEQKEREAAYQVATREIQETVTDYLVSNYAGVTRVEWQGIGVEFLASDVLGHLLYPNYVSSEARVYVNDTDYLTLRYSLNEEADYDEETSRYVLYGYLTPENMDIENASALRGAKENLSVQEQRVFDEFVKSPVASPDAEITYNVDIFKFDW